jgi:peptidoglycan/xylan/chitin deacetylase (PgdA/CDA1 family)
VIGRLPDAVMYHYVRDVAARPIVGYCSLDPAVFDAQLDDLSRCRTPVGWEDLSDALAGRRALSDDAVVLTFDDSLADHHRSVLPVLAARGLRAIFFVLARRPGDGLTLGHRLHVLQGVLPGADLRDAVTDRLPTRDRELQRRLEMRLLAEGPADPDDVWKRPLQRELASVAEPILAALVAECIGPEREVAEALHLSPPQLDDLVGAGMTLGGHGRDHRWLDAAPRATVRAELESSASFLAERSPGPWPFAYPFGGVPRGATGLLRAAGFAAAFTTRAGVRRNRYLIGRHDADELGRTPSAIMDRR